MARRYERTNSEYLKADMGTTLDALSDFTILWWYKVHATASGTDYLLSFPEASAGTNGLDFYMLSGTTELRGRMTYHTSSQLGTFPGGSVTQDVWNCAILNCTDTGSAYQGLFYQNGSLTGFSESAAAGGLKHASGEINIGRFGSFGAYADITSGMIAVWNTDIGDGQTTRDVQDALYNNGKGLSPLRVQPDNLILYMPFTADVTNQPTRVGSLSSYSSTDGADAAHHSVTGEGEAMPPLQYVPRYVTQPTGTAAEDSLSGEYLTCDVHNARLPR